MCSRAAGRAADVLGAREDVGAVRRLHRLDLGRIGQVGGDGRVGVLVVVVRQLADEAGDLREDVREAARIAPRKMETRSTRARPFAKAASARRSGTSTGRAVTVSRNDWRWGACWGGFARTSAATTQTVNDGGCRSSS